MGKYEQGASKKQKRAGNPLTVPVIVLSITVVVLLGVIAAMTLKPAPEPEKDAAASIYYEGDTCIASPYGVLHLPEQWSDSLMVTAQGSESAYTLTVSAKLSGRDPMGLFRVHFNEDGDMALGIWQTEKGVANLALTAIELRFDDSWSPQDIDLLCAMQESTNYMTDALRQEEGFAAH